MKQITAAEKYSQPEVIECWQNLSRAGLQKAEQELLRRYLSRPSRVLDVGCGAGRAVLALNQAGHQVTGIDVSLPMLAAGRQLSASIQLSGADLLALPVVDSSFEAVIMFFGALQHIQGQANRGRALAELARVSQSKGRLLVGLDNLAPTLSCYAFWFSQKLRPDSTANPPPTTSSTAADSILWSRRTRQLHPVIWHLRGLARTLRWRTWPGFIDLIRQSGLVRRMEPGDSYVAQFSLQTTAGRIYYHRYRADEFIAEATGAGWLLLGYHSGTELSEARLYPPAIRSQDKQLFFAFEKGA
jgi:SAM-dependent methyltransferase